MGKLAGPVSILGLFSPDTRWSGAPVLTKKSGTANVIRKGERMRSPALFPLLVRSLILSLVMLIGLGMSMGAPAWAQDDASAEAASSEEDAGPSFPPGLDNPQMGLDELTLRLIPLTAGELSALAAAWQEIVRGQTEVLVDATVASQKKPDGPSQDDLDRIVELTETRGEGFER